MDLAAAILEHVLDRRPAMNEAQRALVRRGFASLRVDGPAGTVEIRWLDRDGSVGRLVDELPVELLARAGALPLPAEVVA